MAQEAAMYSGCARGGGLRLGITTSLRTGVPQRMPPTSEEGHLSGGLCRCHQRPNAVLDLVARLTRTGNFVRARLKEDHANFIAADADASRRWRTIQT